MWKLITDKGEKLPDLLVVLAITVVMAAVLLPAVTSSQGNEVSADTNEEVAARPIMDGVVGTTTAPDRARRERYAQEDRMSDTVAPAWTDELSAPATTTLEAGLQEMRTTDIKYVIP